MLEGFTHQLIDKIETKMSNEFQIVVCGSVVPDPLQNLEPVSGPSGPLLKNEMMLPAVLDPWAAHSLYEAANLAKQNPNSKVYLVSLGPKAKLQQLMMIIAQKVSFELIAIDGPGGGFIDSFEVANVLKGAIEKIPALDKSKLLLFGGCASASRDASSTMQILGEMLGIKEQFLGVDKLEVQQDGKLKILERIEGGKYQVSICDGPPVVLGWATGYLPDPPNNPQLGMTNMRFVMPALQKAQSANINPNSIVYKDVKVPMQQRKTRVVKDMSTDEIAKEIVEWIKN